MTETQETSFNPDHLALLLGLLQARPRSLDRNQIASVREALGGQPNQQEKDKE